MRELVGGKNTIGWTAAVLKKPHKATFNLFLTPSLHTYMKWYYHLFHIITDLAMIYTFVTKCLWCMESVHLITSCQTSKLWTVI